MAVSQNDVPKLFVHSVNGSSRNSASLRKTAVWRFRLASIMTPLHLAAREEFLVVAKMLIEHNANRKITDHRGWTALKWAEVSHHDAVAALPRENGVSN